MKTLRIFIAMCFILGFTSNLNAQTVVDKWIDIPFAADIPCVDEVAYGTLSLNVVEHTDKDGNLTFYHYNPFEGELVGEKSGTIYRPVGKTQEHIKSVLSNGAWTDTFTNTFKMIGKNGVNLTIVNLIHTTINSNGEVTATVDKTTVTCK